jgi:Protein of unknown function (DUF4054)
MATPTAADVKQRYPELASIPDATVNLSIGDAVPFFDEERWGAFFAQGFCAFVAHQLTANARAATGAQATAGPVASKAVGSVSIAYQAGETLRATDAYYASTAYGQRYLQLRRLVGVGALAV